MRVHNKQKTSKLAFLVQYRWMGGKAGGGKVDMLGLGVSLATITNHKVTFYLSILTTH